MDATTQSAAASGKSARPVSSPETGARMDSSAARGSQFGSLRKPAGYGMPCAKCHLYYPADLDTCPICSSKERVAPVVPAAPPKIAQSDAEPTPDAEALEHEREEFLRQFKSQLFAAHAQVANAPALLCNLEENHSAQPENAEVCKHCYDRLQERMDVCEAALHIDVKGASQIIYDAVWADPSDPSKTYTNAASALLTELRKRAGISTVLGPFQPLAD